MTSGDDPKYLREANQKCLVLLFPANPVSSGPSNEDDLHLINLELMTLSEKNRVHHGFFRSNEAIRESIHIFKNCFSKIVRSKN